MHNHLKLLEACGYIAMSRARHRNPKQRVLVIHLSPAARIRHRPLPPEIEAMWALRRRGAWIGRVGDGRWVS
jgi:hypothetical protein